MLSIPALLAYTIMPLAQGIWQKIYSWLYDIGSNFLYADSWSQRVMAATMSESQEFIEDEINVDLE
jgi:hypothetical protein